jgi:transposase-like protein
LLLEHFNKRKRCVTGRWHVNETYIKVRDQWMYLYRAIVGDTVEFLFSQHRDLTAAKRFFNKALERHGRPNRVVIDGSQTNREAIVACDTTGASSAACGRRLGSNRTTARIILSGIEMIHMMRKRQPRYAFNPNPSLGEQFAVLAA